MPKKPDQKREPGKVYSPKGGAGIIPGNPGNSGGKKGRSGRPPLAFKALCRDILEDKKTQDALRKAAAAPHAPGYGGVIKTLAAYAEGLPVQPVVHSGKITHELSNRLQAARERSRHR